MLIHPMKRVCPVAVGEKEVPEMKVTRSRRVKSTNILFKEYFQISRFNNMWRLSGKESIWNAGVACNLRLILGSGRSPGVGNGNPLQYSYQENSMDRGAWYSPWGRKESDMTEQLSTHSKHLVNITLVKLWSNQPSKCQSCNNFLPVYFEITSLESESESEVAQSCPTLCDPMDCTRLLRPWDSQGKNTGVGCHFLLQGIFPTQGLNLGLPPCRQML